MAKRLVAALRAETGLPCLDYIFNEEGAELPDLGGIQSPLHKRTRHRRALVRLLFEAYRTDRLLVCVDPSGLDLMQDFYGDRALTRLLQIRCEFSDDYLAGHARRVGLAGAETSEETLARLLPTIRYDIMHEADRIRDAGFPHHHEFREAAPPEENAAALAAFLDLSPEVARRLAETPYLFAD